MSGRPYTSASSSHHRAQETHRYVTSSHTHTQQTTIHRTSTSTSSNQWRSGTNNKGNLVIAKKAEPSKSAETRAEKKIWKILEDFNRKARTTEITKTTSDIMRVVRKFIRGEYNDAVKTSSTMVTASASQVRATTSQTQPAKSALKSTPKNTKIVAPKKVADRLTNGGNQKRANSSETSKMSRITRELMNLCSSDGFVDKPPIEHKRTPRKVTRFSEAQYDKTLRSTRRKSTGMSVQERTIQKKVVQPSTPSRNLSGASTSLKTTVTQTKSTVFVPIQPVQLVQPIQRVVVTPNPSVPRPGPVKVQRSAQISSPQPPIVRIFQPPIIRPAIVRPPIVQPPIVQPPIVQPPIVQTTTVRPPIIQTTTVQPPIVQPAISQASSVSKNGANFTHNRIKITHHPMVEVKLEELC